MTEQPKNIQHSLFQYVISQKNYYICQKYYIMCIKLRVAYQKKKKKFTIKDITWKLIHKYGAPFV